jgi:sporulation protein YlmC with PRC-barrel domain
MRFELGSSVSCADGDFGELVDVVVDPVNNRVTHLVIKPHGFGGISRLVPIEHVERAPGGRAEPIRLALRSDQVHELEYVTEYASFTLGNVPKVDSGWDVGVESIVAMPSDEIGLSGGEFLPAAGSQYDRIPAGEAELRHSTPIRSTDGDYVGEMGGFLVDNVGKISDLVIERGHLWRRREVTIPIALVTQVQTDAVTINLSKADVRSLPSAKASRRWW